MDANQENRTEEFGLKAIVAFLAVAGVVMVSRWSEGKWLTYSDGYETCQAYYEAREFSSNEECSDFYQSWIRNNCSQ